MNNRIMKKRLKRKMLIALLVTLLLCLTISSCYMINQRSHDVLLYNAAVDPTQGDGDSMIVVVHGWLEQGTGDWAQSLCDAIAEKVDSNEFSARYFDWGKGSTTIDPRDAAKYAKETGGNELAEQILKNGTDFEHFHLISHSCGCWLINETAKILAQKTGADIHLTFLDAYVPQGWDESELGNVTSAFGGLIWADHYYTRDYTLKETQIELTNAHNVDISALDNWPNDHNFPRRWYLATVMGEYPEKLFDDGQYHDCIINGVKYGFALSKEAGQDWDNVTKLTLGNKAILASEK